MARKRIEHMDEDIDDSVIDAEFEDISGLQHDIDQQLDTIFAEIGDGDNDIVYGIKVYRTQKGTVKLGYLFSCTVHELPLLDRLRDEYGGGDFEVRVLGGGKIKTRRMVCVEPPPKKKESIMEPITGLGEVMAQGFTRLGELILKSNNAPQQGGMKEMLESMKLMKEVMGTSGETTAPVNVFDQIKSVVEVQKLLSGKKESAAETNVNDVLLSLAETVLPKIAEATISAQGVNKDDSTPTKDTAAPHLPTQIKNENIRENPMKMQLVFLCMQAGKNKDPALYANLVLDNTPDDKIDALYEFMENENSIKTMIAIHKPVEKYQEWFEKLRQEIFKLIEVVEEKDGDETLTDNKKLTIGVDNVSEPEKDNGDIVIDPERPERYKSSNENDEPANKTG